MADSLPLQPDAGERSDNTARGERAEGMKMITVTASTDRQIPWWREPTKEQWLAYVAAWLGWTLDAFDFTVFLLIMVPIAKEFQVPLTEVTLIFTVTLWMRLIGATASGWLADRVGRKTPLMISILWYSICNFIAGFSPTFWFLFLFRALLGIGMGAEWPAGAALAMESWPPRTRGLMSGALQGSWGLGFLLSSAAYGLLFNTIGWRGLLWLGVLPALVTLYIRKFVKEPEVWRENREKQRQQREEFKAPLLEIFRVRVLGNTLTACLWMGSGFVVYYTVFGLFPTHLQKDLHFSPGAVALPVAFANGMTFVSSCIWGYVADRIGRRWSMIIPALIGIVITPFYLGFITTSCSAGRRLYDPGLLCRQHLRAEPRLSQRALSNRGASHRRRFLLSPGCDLGWARRAAASGLGGNDAERLYPPDADCHDGFRSDLCRRAAAWPGDQRQNSRVRH
jgi:SHS family lactate transporter-like MFS transporter